MTNKISKNLIFILSGFVIAVTTALSVPAQTSPDVIMARRSKGQTLIGVIRVQKEFGRVPAGPGNSQAAINPCGQFYVAVLDPDNGNSFITSTDRMELGREDEVYYTCKYSMTVPANKRLFAIAGMGGVLLLPKQSRDAMYITDAWIGGTRNKPPKGWERGFAGKFVTLGTVKGTYLKFDMYYAQVDPN
ncbi:MAG: hypothetical protein ABIO36_03410 [Pyrinomonadaceae bacterium]